VSAGRFPIRLLAHFGRTATPLVQVTDARIAAGGGWHGAGTRVLDLSNAARQIALRDPKTGERTGDYISAADALRVLVALSYDEGN